MIKHDRLSAVTGTSVDDRRQPGAGLSLLVTSTVRRTPTALEPPPLRSPSPPSGPTATQGRTSTAAPWRPGWGRSGPRCATAQLGLMSGVAARTGGTQQHCASPGIRRSRQKRGSEYPPASGGGVCRHTLGHPQHPTAPRRAVPAARAPPPSAGPAHVGAPPPRVITSSTINRGRVGGTLVCR